MASRRVAPVVLLLLFSGCAGDHNKGMRPGGEEGARLSVPFFADRRDQWGPAALASVLTFWGKPAEPDALRREIYFPKQRKSVALDLKNAARARGLAAEMATGGDLKALKAELDAGRPVIVFIDTGFKPVPVRSFMVVSGYDDWLGGVYAHFGPNKDQFLKYARFDSDWARTDRWWLRIAKRDPEAVKQASEASAAPPVLPPPAECRPAAPARGGGKARGSGPPRCPAPIAAGK